jgi:hypothetical protein
MIGLLCFALAVLASPFKSKLRLQAENAVLRHQLNVLRRRLHGRVRLTNHDRWFFIQLYRWFPSILQVLTIIRPETLVGCSGGEGLYASALSFRIAAIRETFEESGILLARPHGSDALIDAKPWRAARAE